MTTANYNLRLDAELKAKAFAVIESYGLSPAQAIRLFLKQTAETQHLPLSFDYQPAPSNSTLEAIRQLENGETTIYDNIEALAGAVADENP